MIVKVKVNNESERWAYFECVQLMQLESMTLDEVHDTFNYADIYVYAKENEKVSVYAVERADKSICIVCFNAYAFLMSESGQTVDKLI